MVLIEVTAEIAWHKSAHDYPCVRVHFYAWDKHFHITRVDTSQGRSISNWLPKDVEIAELIDKRLQAPNFLDALYELAQILKKHGWDLQRR